MLSLLTLVSSGLQDAWIFRRSSSQVFNWLVSLLQTIRLHSRLEQLLLFPGVMYSLISSDANVPKSIVDSQES